MTTIRPRPADAVRQDLVRTKARLARLRRSPLAVEILSPDSDQAAEYRRLLTALGQLRAELRRASASWPGST